MKARTVFIATAILGLLGAVSLWAHQGGYGGGMMNMHGSSPRGVYGGHMMGMYPHGTHAGDAETCGDWAGFFLEKAEALSLTEEQTASLKAIRSDYRKGVIRIDGRIRALQVDINDLLSESEASPSTVEGKIREQGRLRTERELAYVRTLSKAREVLTRDQLDALGHPSDWQSADGWILCHGQRDTEVEGSTSTTWDEDALTYP